MTGDELDVRCPYCEVQTENYDVKQDIASCHSSCPVESFILSRAEDEGYVTKRSN